MNNERNPDDLEEYPQALLLAIRGSYSEWLRRRIHVLAQTSSVTDIPAEVVDSCAVSADKQLFELLSTDVDAQRSNPLHVLRESTKAASVWLRDNGVELAQRDEFEIAAMPNDIFAIGPLTWLDLGESVHEAGISWGAWKAAVVLTRRRNEGKFS